MPPKGKGDKAKANQVDPAVLEKQVNLSQLKRQCEAHERMIHVGSEQLQRSQLETLNLKKKLVELNHRFTKEESATASMTHDMFRVYTDMQSKMMERIEQHQATIRGLRKELSDARQSLEHTKAKKDFICAEKTRQINEQKQKMEEMAIAFGVELKETLDKMSRNIKEGH
jgi:predicted  nucleic acid-binding Zn-ribbon protein